MKLRDDDKISESMVSSHINNDKMLQESLAEIKKNKKMIKKLKTWYVKHNKMMEILFSYIIIMILPTLIAPLINQS